MSSNPDDWGVKDSGYERPTYDEILTAVKRDIQLLFGTDIDLSSESPVGQLAQVIARQMAETWSDAELSYDAGFLSSATGTNLDKLAEIRQIPRNPATYASGAVRFTRATAAQRAYQIPVNTVVATADRSLTFQTTEPGEIAEGGVSSQLVPVVATETGTAYNLAANTLTIIATPVLGVDGVSNPEEVGGGSNAESDAVYRARIKKTVPEASGTLSAITSAVTMIDGVRSVNIFEDTNYGVVYAYVLGGDDTEIQTAIDAVRPAGIGVVWNRPTPSPVSVTGSATANSQAIAEAVTAYLNSLDIGKDVTYSALVSAAMSASGGAQIMSLTATYSVQTISSLGDAIIISDGSLATTGTITFTEYNE